MTSLDANLGLTFWRKVKWNSRPGASSSLNTLHFNKSIILHNFNEMNTSSNKFVSHTFQVLRVRYTFVNWKLFRADARKGRDKDTDRHYKLRSCAKLSGWIAYHCKKRKLFLWSQVHLNLKLLWWYGGNVCYSNICWKICLSGNEYIGASFGVNLLFCGCKKKQYHTYLFVAWCY